MKNFLLICLFSALLFSCREKETTNPEPEPAAENTTEFNKEDVAEKGMKYAQTTQQLLAQNLLKAIGDKGTLHAVEFCNVEAMPLTRKMEEEHNAYIRRVSDRNRNEKNEASEQELDYIEHFKEQIATGKDPEPIVITENGRSRFYATILTNKMCLQCHGKPEQMKPEVIKKLQDLYPNDKAIGYSENEVRGMWSIEFEE
ncbi:DUF3365 domain-containing protein [Antarcticibacterium flavum]|uniref:DUF3365 domain-containing protein n=1 Tax=Antarcticibacterium flavum TaxID=2058175 RepID=A0A5B7X0I0_9FLAO|nr:MULTISPECIES: DUF3365 domain-containing protein [Antarcticibacterium]MCM4159836.1 hypothetical protein [Antarcticibacterium sp. W02-3]QCY68839.1 DUF3365 domain-containing protein [Antarcticibacterium flavum]